MPIAYWLCVRFVATSRRGAACYALPYGVCVRYSSRVCRQNELEICTVACFLHAWHTCSSYCMMHMHGWYDVRSFWWCTVFFGAVRSFSLEEARGLKSRVLLEAQWRLLWFIFILIKLMCYLTALWTLWVCLRRELFGNSSKKKSP